MVHAQGAMDLLLELNVRVDFVRYGNGSVKLRECACIAALTSLRLVLGY